MDVDSCEYLALPCNPNDIGGDKNTAYAAIKIPGMSHPRCQYVAAEPASMIRPWMKSVSATAKYPPCTR